MQLLLRHCQTIPRKIEMIHVGKPYPECLGIRPDILLCLLPEMYDSFISVAASAASRSSSVFASEYPVKLQEPLV